MDNGTEDKGIVESLFKSYELYRILFENAYEPILFTSDLRIIDCNLATLALFGLATKPEITGRHLFELSPEKQDDGTPSKEKIQELIASLEYGTTEKFGWKYHKSDGTPVYTEVIANLFRHEGASFQQFAIHDLTSLRNKEIELNQTELKYKKIFENVQDVFYRTDLNGILTEISPSIKRYSKYIHSDIIGQPIEKFYVNPHVRLQLIYEIQEKGEVLDFEILLKGLDNQEVWSSVNAHFTYDDSGNVNGVEGTIRELTERKQAEEKLKQSFSLLQTTLDSTTNGILVVDHNGRITSYNKRFKEIFGHPIEILESGIDAAAIECVLTQLKDPGQFVSKIQYLYDHPEMESLDTIELLDGRILERYSGPQLLDDKPIGRVWSFTDITERKRAEEQLLLMAHTVKSINESISITDTSNRVLFVNEAFLKTYGYTDASELIGQNISMVRSPLSDPEVTQKILDSTAQSGWQGELINKKKDGTEFLISLSTSIIQNEHGEILGMVGVATDISERKLVEKELQESENRYRLLIETQGEGIGMVDLDEKFIFVNPAAEQIFGVPPGQLINRNLNEFVPPDQFGIVLQESEKRSKNEKSSYELEIITPQGARRNILVTATPQNNSSGVCKGTFGVFRDITDRKTVEKELQAKEAHLSTLIRTIPDLIWVKDVNGVFLTCNKMFEDFFGAPAEKITGKSDYDFVDKELADFFRKNDINAIEAGKPTSNEEWVTFASDGHRALLETIKSPMYDSKGAIIGVLGIGRDITDRKNAEEKLRESETKYRNLIETMPDGVYRSTPEGRFVEVNPAMVKLLGYNSKEDLMSIDIKTQLYFNPEDRETLMLALNPENLEIYPLKKKDGTAVWIEDHGWYVKDTEGKVLFHEGVSRDITDRRLAQIQLQKYSEELKELNATKDKYFSIIAHDLKNPFNSIIGLSDIIRTEAKHLDIATIEQYAGFIHTTSTNTFKLLENLLDWARIQQSQMPFQPVPLILKKLVDDVLELMIEKANSKMIAIINYISDKLIITADKNMLETIFRNLLSNALKFTSVNGKVEIRAISRSNAYEIAVKDTGIGIKKEDLNKIFEIGSGFSTRGTENEKGTGLGLLLCKEFVEKHQGKIWVESEEGKGSTFNFTINQNDF